MLKDTIQQIENAIKKIDSVDGKKKAELLGLLAALKSELERLSETHEEDARSIAGFAELAAREALRKQKSPGLMKHSLDGLALSAEGFEASHPRLVEIIDAISGMLARIGI